MSPTKGATPRRAATARSCAKRPALCAQGPAAAAPRRRIWPGVLLAAAQAGCSILPPAAPETPPATSVPEAPPAVAAPPNATDGSDATATTLGGLVEEADEVLETTRSGARALTESLARGIDRWFGDKPFEEGGAVTNGQLALGVLKRQQESPEYSLRFNARLRLPNVEEKTYLYFGRDDQRDVITDRPGALSSQERLSTPPQEQPSFFAGLGRHLDERTDLRLGFRGVKPYAQARYRYGWDVGTAGIVEFRETLFWTVADHIGSTTALSWQRGYTPSLAARWVVAATITQEAPKFAWSSVLGGYMTFGDQRLLSAETLISGVQGSGVGVSDYGVQARWSQPLHKEWLVGEVLLGHFWPRKDSQSVRENLWVWGATMKIAF